MTQQTMKTTSKVLTGVLSVMVLFGGFMQMITHEQVVTVFHRMRIDNLMMIRFLGLMKVLGAVALWVPNGRPWAVHGFTFLFFGALATHLGAGDPPQEFVGATLALCLLWTSECLACKSGMPSACGTMGRRAA